MDYIIPQSKLSKSIYNYIDELFSSEDGDTTIHKLKSIDEDGNPLVDSYDFINNDYYDGDNQDYLFSWTGKEYYENHQRQSFGARLVNEAPIVEIHDKNKVMTLNSIFSEMWIPIFNKWFQDKVNLPIKTLYT